MFSLSQDSPTDYVTKRVAYFEREVFTASNVAYQFLDVICERPDSFDECFALLPAQIREELASIAAKPDADYYANQFSILSDPVGTSVDRVEITGNNPPKITVFICHGSDPPKPYVVDESHPFRFSVEMLRKFLDQQPE